MTTAVASVAAKEESKCPSKKSAIRGKRKHKIQVPVEETTNKAPSAPPAEASETECEATKPSGKVAIPRLPNNKSPRPSSAIVLVPTAPQQPSSPQTSKTKFVPIQPKPCDGAVVLPQLKEENSAATDQWEGLHDEELANYWPQPGLNGECHSPKPNQELSQLRVLLEQNEGKTQRQPYSQ